MMVQTNCQAEDHDTYHKTWMSATQRYGSFMLIEEAAVVNVSQEKADLS